MITVKFSADNVRLFKKAATAGELRGCLDLVLERIEQSEALRVFGKEPTSEMRKAARYNWKTAKEVMGRVLGDQLRSPPFPDPIWYQRVCRNMRLHDLDEEKLTKLAVYAKENLKAPYGLDFLVGQYERVLAGTYDVKKAGPTLLATWRDTNALPEE